MRTTILLAVLALMLGSCKSQQDPAQKAAEKAAKEAQGQMQFDKAMQAVNNKAFVLEADRVTFKNGQFVYVNANTNFISMHDGKSTVQLAFNSPYAGPNGIGGITVTGTVSNFKTETDKKGNVTISMAVMGVGISANVSIQLINGSNVCSATVYPNFSGNIITFSGNLYSEADSNVFKGMSL